MAGLTSFGPLLHLRCPRCELSARWTRMDYTQPHFRKTFALTSNNENNAFDACPQRNFVVRSQPTFNHACRLRKQGIGSAEWL